MLSYPETRNTFKYRCNSLQAHVSRIHTTHIFLLYYEIKIVLIIIKNNNNNENILTIWKIKIILVSLSNSEFSQIFGSLFQVSLDCIIDPPKPQEASYPLFCHETVTFGTYAGVLARTVFNRVNRIPGLSCSPVQAGYCAFIKVTKTQDPHWWHNTNC